MVETTFSNNFLDAQRLAGDAAADNFIAAQFADAGNKTALQTWLQFNSANSRLAAIPAAYTPYEFISKAGQLPGWAEPKLMKAGAAFFARHAQAVMNLLGLLSLPYCYAASQGAMVLYLSERIKADTGRRLSDTAGFVWDVMAPNAFEPDGKGLASCLNIRLTHAAARYYTLKSGRWNQDWGSPVNQEDMAGTNLAFSLMVIRGLRKLGYTIAYEEQQSFMHLWNIIGHLLGLNDSLLPPDGKRANQLEEAIRIRQFRPSVQGRALTRSLIDYFSVAGSGAAFSPAEVMQLMRYLLGHEVADLLDLPSSSISSLRLKLLQTLYFVNELKQPADLTTAYREGYRQFSKAQAELLGK